MQAGPAEAFAGRHETDRFGVQQKPSIAAGKLITTLQEWANQGTLARGSSLGGSTRSRHQPGGGWPVSEVNRLQPGWFSRPSGTGQPPGKRTSPAPVTPAVPAAD